MRFLSFFFAVGCVGVTALPCPADVLQSLTQPIEGRLQRASSGLFDPESNLDALPFRSGQRRIVADLKGPGEVRHLWFTISSRDRRYPRTLVLRIYYDDAKTPSVETPIGDFFAAGNGMRANVSSKPVETSSYGRALNCYWRMPFRKRCRIELHNQSSHSMSVYVHADWMKLDSLPPATRYFHARYRQEYPPKPFSWYTVCEIQGEGHYVGTVFSSQNNLDGWFGETDDRFYIDGEEEPSIIGTGTEDYFNDAWNLRVTNNQRVGTTICEPRSAERRITAYRWHLDDPIPFKKSLKFELERRSYTAVRDKQSGRRMLYGFKYRPDYWSSVSYWYQNGVAPPPWDFPTAEERLFPEVWIEPAQIVDQVAASPDLKPRQRSNRTCHQKKCFYVRNDKPGGWVEFPVKIDTRGRYTASVFANLKSEHGVWRVTLLGEGREIELSKGLDCWDSYLPLKEDWPENVQYGTTREIKLGTHHLQPGDYRVRFECVGANPQTRHPETGEFGKGMSLCLDAINFRRLIIEDPNQWIEDYLAEEETRFASMVKQAQADVSSLALAVDNYRKAMGKYPKSLQAMIGVSIDKDQLTRDPWKQRYQYRSPGVIRPWAYDLWSYHGNSRKPKGWIGNWRNPLDLSKESDLLVFEGEDLKQTAASKGVRSSRQSVDAYGESPISRGKHRFVSLKHRDDWIELALPKSVPPGRYRVHVRPLTSWDFGVCRWRLAGQELSAGFDAYSPTIGVGLLPAVTVDIGAGQPILRLEVTGKNGYSIGHAAGIDAILLQPVK